MPQKLSLFVLMFSLSLPLLATNYFSFDPAKINIKNITTDKQEYYSVEYNGKFAFRILGAYIGQFNMHLENAFEHGVDLRCRILPTNSLISSQQQINHFYIFNCPSLWRKFNTDGIQLIEEGTLSKNYFLEVAHKKNNRIEIDENIYKYLNTLLATSDNSVIEINIGFLLNFNNKRYDQCDLEENIKLESTLFESCNHMASCQECADKKLEE